MNLVVMLKQTHFELQNLVVANRSLSNYRVHLHDLHCPVNGGTRGANKHPALAQDMARGQRVAIYIFRVFLFFAFYEIGLID